jgi:hypothetical protein
MLLLNYAISLHTSLSGQIPHLLEHSLKEKLCTVYQQFTDYKKVFDKKLSGDF